MNAHPRLFASPSGLTCTDLIHHLSAEDRAAFDRERARRDTDIEALHHGVILPQVVANLMMRQAR